MSVQAVVKKYWGFDRLRDMQAESIAATLDRRDSLTVLPTGGGKSLCFQVPPLVSHSLTLVVSPLIALMQDQVAGLTLAGVRAGAIYSNIDPDAAAEVRRSLLASELRLLYVSPERLLQSSFLAGLRKLPIGAVAIDEAHCISQWGHDFRPEYRRLAELRELFPDVPIGAYTATATPRVQADIIEQLGLRTPVQLVGTFDRPNLTYRVIPRVRPAEQVDEALQRHAQSKGQAAIIYCISRKETEQLADSLSRRGHKAEAYHAGLSPAVRARVSKHFRTERTNIVCATVAFGMGIDRPDVRLVVHVGMPKSVEHYQQETGRAGRDGLPAECLLLYSAQDHVRWLQLTSTTSEGEPLPEHVAQAQRELLNHMHALASGARCRHRAIAEYFGQTYPSDDCGACDCCLNELTEIPDAHDTARKIISCVARLDQPYGAGHIADVLIGSRGEKVKARRHDQLSTYGLLREHTKDQVVAFINQLIDAGGLARDMGEFPVVTLSAASSDFLKNKRHATLVQPHIALTRSEKERRATGETSPLSPPEQALADSIREFRRDLAQQRNVPPFVIFGDQTLEELARVRPSSLDTFITIRGIGTKKTEDFGLLFITHIREFCEIHGLTLDAKPAARAAEPERIRKRPEGSYEAAELFRRGLPIEDVMATLGRARSTIADYLADYILDEKPDSIDTWVSPADHARIEEAISACGDQPLLKPIYEHLGGQIGYDLIRAVVTFRRAHAAASNR